MARIDDVTLVAYADGELDAETRREVEAALAEDSEARERVRALRESASLLRGALNEFHHSPVPERLVEAVRRHPAGDPAPISGGGGGAGSVRRWAPALAASVAALVIGAGGGYHLAGLGDAQLASGPDAVHTPLRAALWPTVNNALESSADGASIDWRGPEKGPSGTVRVLRTYLDESGQYCREYRENVTTAGVTESGYGIACRVGEGRWKMRFYLDLGGTKLSKI
jgi:surface antigen